MMFTKLWAGLGEEKKGGCKELGLKGWGSYWNLQRTDRQKGVSERRCGLQETMETQQEEKYPDIILLPPSVLQPPPLSGQINSSQRVSRSVGPVHWNLPPSTQNRWGKWGRGNRWSNIQINLGGRSEMTIHTKNAIWPTPHSQQTLIINWSAFAWQTWTAFTILNTASPWNLLTYEMT